MSSLREWVSAISQRLDPDLGIFEGSWASPNRNLVIGEYIYTLGRICAMGDWLKTADFEAETVETVELSICESWHLAEARC